MDSTIIRLAVLGSTGSIGQQTLQVVRQLAPRFQVVALAAGHNLPLFSQQVAEFQPRYIYHRAGSQIGKAAFIPLEQIATLPAVDIVVVATSGQASLPAVIAAAHAGKRIAIANKEPLVMAGEIITRAVKKHRAQLIPVDSEHSAIWQCLRGEKSPAARLILTASGGPFRDYTAKQMQSVSPAQALKHPSWQMGKKVTIDSATLMNKGLEIIEAHWLFNMPIDKIRVMVHPQSIIHSMVEFTDGAVKAQLSVPDMRLPIQYALTYPQRLANPELPRLDWEHPPQLGFSLPDEKRFPCLKLARQAGEAGGTLPAVLCAADEVAVELFLKGKIKFTDIAALVAAALEKHPNTINPTLEEILAAAALTRNDVNKIIRNK